MFNRPFMTQTNPDWFDILIPADWLMMSDCQIGGQFRPGLDCLIGARDQWAIATTSWPGGQARQLLNGGLSSRWHPAAPGPRPASPCLSEPNYELCLSISLSVVHAYAVRQFENNLGYKKNSIGKTEQPFWPSSLTTLHSCRSYLLAKKLLKDEQDQYISAVNTVQSTLFLLSFGKIKWQISFYFILPVFIGSEAVRRTN